MQDCEGCAHAKVCQYKYLHNKLEDAVRDLADSEGFGWPLTLALACQQYEPAEPHRGAAPWFVDAPYRFKRISSDGTSYEQAEASGVTATLKGGESDGE